MHTGGIYESWERGWISSIPPEKENILRKGKWNTMRIRIIVDSIITWLNGEKMAELIDATVGQGKGRILLQVHEKNIPEIRWKNIKIKESASK